MKKFSKEKSIYMLGNNQNLNDILFVYKPQS